MIENNLIIYPNPAKDKVFVVSPEKISELSIYSLNGKQRINIQPDKKEISVSISSLPQGIYVTNCKTESSMKTQLFIKE